ncbi:MAG: T9SS type A sorting domain-containing protein, partial [Candidatus Cloacimonetes bacterium]|nr:T9SS type A sorting domain-containing protein [Candidatus Cloacimonadota bacterium]
KEKIFLGGWLSGLRLWNDTTYPENGGDEWSYASFLDLDSGRIFAIDKRNKYNYEEIWIASGEGLFMFDESDWFKYGTHIKKKVWQPGGWHDEATSEYWYFEGQERLYGGQTTYPTALFIDPFGVIWIGTKNAGITAYDVDKNIFTNYTMENSPLISNNITDFAYNSTNGILFIGTDEGLNFAQIGISENMNFEENLNKTFCYPNPFYPENGEILKIDNTNAISMPKGDTKCNIYSLDGKLVRVLTKNNYQQFEWNGTNVTEQKCSSGLYFYVVFTQDAQTSNGKIVLIR